MLLEREPEVAWNLLHQLVTSEITTNTPRPNWRDWGTESNRVTYGEYFGVVKKIVRRMIATAGTNGERWRKLIRLLANLPSEEYGEIVERLKQLAETTLDLKDRLAIWDALRRVLTRHRSFQGEKWVLPTERLDELDALYSAFEPDDVESRSAWLFGRDPDLPDGYLLEPEKGAAALTEERRQAVLLLQSHGGIQSLYHVVPMVENPWALGSTAGGLPAFVDDENDLFERYLAAPEALWRDFALGFVVGRIRQHGRNWVRDKLADTGNRLSPPQRADLLFGLECSRETWTFVESLDAETAASYWRRVQPFPKGWSDPDLEYAVRKLLEYSRPYDAVEILAYFKANPNLHADALEAILRLPDTATQPDHFYWHLQEMFKVLQGATELDHERLARLEWAFLPILDRHEFAPLALQKELARNPGFFAEIVALVYRAEDDEERVEPTDLERARAERGHYLLQSSRICPGVNENGEIDGAALRRWVQEARAALAEKRRRRVGEQHIGIILSHFPEGSDCVWPHEAAREVIENAESEELERGIEIGVYNRRGLITRKLMEGGEQEHELAKQFGDYASALAARWPRTAAMLRGIAARYERDATREDIGAELKKDGIWN